jgi:hypothetical protein
MSLTGSLNISPYSLTGINNFDGTVNGLVPVSVITIAGQTAFLSWNTSTSTLTLVIPTSNGVVALRSSYHRLIGIHLIIKKTHYHLHLH